MLSALELYRRLLDQRGEPRWWSEDPFIVMFQSVLVQNTAWRSVEKTCAAIRDELTLTSILEMPIEKLETLIRPCGFCKAKAQTIKALAAWYSRHLNGTEPFSQLSTDQLRQELLSLRGVGAETADVVLVYALYRPSFIVDAYTRRFLSRLGCDFSSDGEIRRFAAASLPRDARVYGWFHWLILDHCIEHCKKQPLCEGCCFRAGCAAGNA